jgi:peptidoglycan-associated lipoprotein
MGKSWGLRTISSMGLFLAIVLLLSGCPKRADLGELEAGSDATAMQSEEVVKQSKSIQEPPAAGAPSARQPATAGKESPLKDIFFDFDKSTIRDDVKSSLNENLQWLNANPAARIIIEGHCDERGTAEYNLGLGERRAKATKDYLVAAGIDVKRIRTVSFGKERPFVAGHDESAWKWNRRAHFVVDER